MNIISNRFVILSIVALGFLSVSCSSHFLDVEPQQSVSGNTVIVDGNTAETAILGVYSQLQNRLYYGGDGYAATAYLSSGDHIWVGTLNYYNAFTTHSYRPDNTLLNNVWYQIYAVVNGANNVIDKVGALPSDAIDSDTRNRYIGEAYFIRALAFFDLARAWGNIPLVLQATSSVNDSDGIGQSNKQEVFARALEDLTLAEGLLPSTTDRNRVTRKTVYALKARVHLYNGDWQEAIDYSTRIIEDTDYELIGWSSFINDKNTRESIFELAFSTADQSAHYGSWSSGDYRNQFCPGPEIYAVLQQSAIGGDRSILIKDISTTAIRNYFVQELYWRPTGDNPTYILRLAEQYLIRAEAYLKIGSPNAAAALNDLNAVRNRANVDELSVSDTEELLTAIADERRVEFVLEPHRWFDLVRTQEAGNVLGVTDRNRWIFPIPYNDLAVDTDLVQNEGYD